MAQRFRSVLNFFTIAVFVAVGTVRGDVLCFGEDGHVAIEVQGECNDCRNTSGQGTSIEAPPCIDIPVTTVAASRTDPRSPDAFPPPAILAVSALVPTRDVGPVLKTRTEPLPPVSSGPPMRTVILLI